MTQTLTRGQLRGARGSRSRLARPLAAVFRKGGGSLRSHFRHRPVVPHHDPETAARGTAPGTLSDFATTAQSDRRSKRREAVRCSVTFGHLITRAIQGGACVDDLAPIRAFISVPRFRMEANRNTIGLGDLLDQISCDLDELRRKHPGDYAMKNITMWWELEKERLLTRHSPASVVNRHRNVWRFRQWTVVFFAGCMTMLAVNIAF